MNKEKLIQILETDAKVSGLIRQRMIEIISLLSKDEQRVLRFRFGLDDGKPRSKNETAVKFGITTGEVGALEKSAMQKLADFNK